MTRARMAMTERGLDDICRLCAIESESCLPIYSQEGESLSLEQKIITCLHIKISRNDYLPKQVCGTCSTLLEEFHQFSCRAANAQQTLNFLFDLQLRPLHDQELGILQNVKLEGNLIKNELDDVHLHPIDPKAHSRERGTQDFLSVFSDYQLTCPTLSPVYRAAIPCKSKGAENTCEMASTTTSPRSTTTAASDEPKPSHRRKMLQPKKTAEKSLEAGIQAALLEQVSLLQPSSMDVECLLNSNTGMAVEPVQCPIEGLGQRKDDTLCIQEPVTEEIVVTEEVQCLMDSNVTVGGQEVVSTVSAVEQVEQAEVEALIEPQTRDDDFGSVVFDEAELFEDLEDDEETSDVKPRVNSLALTKDWNIICDKCNQVFPQRAPFDAHYRTVHGSEPVYTCSQCGKAIANFSSFRSHFYRHDSNFPCIYCDKVFKLEGMLRTHVLARHATERPFICEFCGKGYVTQYRLNSHKKQHLSQDQEFRCTQCDKVLRTKNGLTCHMTAHKLGRQFMCDLCGKTFTQKVNMLQHVKFHKGERPFACDQCNKRFAERSHLNRHKQFHSIERPFQCTVCQKMYKTERCLKVHSQVHLVTRPYTCPDCGKGFLNITKLKQHYHCHTGERPYACKYCERTFTNYPNWLKHTRRRHKVDHKTGLKLEEEAPPLDPSLSNCDPLPELDDFDIAEVKVKDVEGDATLLLSPGSAQSILTQFHVAADFAHFQLPDGQLLQYHDTTHTLPL